MSIPHGFIDPASASALLEASANVHAKCIVELALQENAKAPGLEGTPAESVPEVGYLQVTVSAERCLALLESPDICAAALQGESRSADLRSVPDKLTDYTEPAGNNLSIHSPRLATTLRPDEPFFPIAEVGLDRLRHAVPQADGRGIVVGLVDDGLDLLHPAVALGRTASGEFVPKILDLELSSIPASNGQCVDMTEVVVARDGSFERGDAAWQAPYDGAFRFGFFRHSLNWSGLVLEAALLWDQQKGLVWVDTNRDRDFTDSAPLHDYANAREIGWFGKKEGADDNRIPYMLKIDAALSRIYFRVPGQHGVWVTGAMGANQEQGGLFEGAAPGVRILDVAGLSKLAYLRAFAHPETHLVNRSGGVGRAAKPEGLEAFDWEILGRAVEYYNKPFLIYGEVPGSIFVHDYQTAEMLKRNRQLSPPYLESTNAVVNFTENGLVNVVLAPSTTLLADSRYNALRYRKEKGAANKEPTAPEGYAVGSNPSCTIGYASGLMASLIGAAKASNVRSDVHRLNNAIFTSCRLLDDLPASQQGHGLVDAMGALAQLKAMERIDRGAKTPTRFVLEVERDGKLTPAFGYAREFLDSIAYEESKLWITRIGGQAGTQDYRLTFKADVAAFSLRNWSISLPRDEAVPLTLYVHARPGHHVSFLRLIEANSGTVMQDVPLQLRAPELPYSVAPGEDLYHQILPPRRTKRFCIGHPDEVQARRLTMRTPFAGTGTLRMMPGVHNEPRILPEGITLDPVTKVGPIQTLETLLVSPGPGLDSIFWENSGRPEYLTEWSAPAPMVAIQAELLVKSYTVGWRVIDGNLEGHNRLAAIEGSVRFFATDGDFGSSIETVGPRHRGGTGFSVGEGTDALRLTLMPSRRAELLEAFLLHQDGEKGWRVRHRQAIESETIITLLKPAAGAWKLMTFARAYDPSPGPLRIDVRGASLRLLHETAPAPHAHDARWIDPLPAEGRAAYVAFHIPGPPGNERQKEGVLIAWQGLSA